MTLEKIANVRERPLPTGLIISSVITDRDGRPIYCYEDWLRELIDESKAFMTKTGGEHFVAPAEESHGESDALTSRYSIDFKLIMSWSMLRALRESSDEITVVEDGLTLFGPGRYDGSIRGVRLHAALRGCDSSKLRSIWGVNPKRDCKDEVDRDIARFLKSLDYDKHLLLLYPSLLYTESGAQISCNDVSDAIYSDFADSLNLRAEFHPSFDSYLAFVFDGNLVILEARRFGFTHFDSVPLSASETFMKASSHYSPLEYAQIGRLFHGE